MRDLPTNSLTLLATSRKNDAVGVLEGLTTRQAV